MNKGNEVANIQPQQAGNPRRLIGKVNRLNTQPVAHFLEFKSILDTLYNTTRVTFSFPPDKIRSQVTLFQLTYQVRRKKTTTNKHSTMR